jgi:hypothetical protein
MVDLVENFSTEGRAAVDVLKDFVQSTIGTAALDERALILAGLPCATLDF